MADKVCITEAVEKLTIDDGLCKHTFLLGQFKNKMCSNKSVDGEEYCKIHIKGKKHNLYNCEHINRKTKEKCDKLTQSESKLCIKHKKKEIKVREKLE